MWSWQKAGLLIALLIAVGKFLESGHISSRSVERLKVVLIRFYFWLDQLPARLPNSFFGRYFPVGTLIIRYWARSGVVGRVLIFLFALPLLVVGGVILWAIFQVLPYTGAAFRMAESPAILSGITLVVFETLLHSLLTALFLLYFSTTIILDLLRRASIIFLDRASAPETKPIGYFTSLLAVFVALFTLVNSFLPQS